MFGFHFALGIGEIGKLEDRDISFETVDGKTCVTVHIRGSKNDQCKVGAHRTLVMTGCPLFPLAGIAQWMGAKSRRPQASTSISGSSIAKRSSCFLESLDAECGMGQERAISHSMREGCAATLYANGVDPADIQRWGRWKSPAYMMYVWYENAKLHTMSHALTRRTTLMGNLLAPGQKKRKVTFQDSYRCGGSRITPADDTLSQDSEKRTFSAVMSSFDREMVDIMENPRLGEEEKVRNTRKSERRRNAR